MVDEHTLAEFGAGVDVYLKLLINLVKEVGGGDGSGGGDVVITGRARDRPVGREL